jgi:hypothetical protein
MIRKEYSVSYDCIDIEPGPRFCTDNPGRFFNP